MSDPPVISGEGDFTYYIPGGHSFRYGTAGSEPGFAERREEFGDPDRSRNEFLDQHRSGDEPRDGWAPPPPRYDSDLALDVEPNDLGHFAEMLEEDRSAFTDAKGAAVDELAGRFPNFTGSSATAMADLDVSDPANVVIAGAMAEGVGFQHVYLMSYLMLQRFINDSTWGLAMLRLAATKAHAAYLVADFFRPPGEHGASGNAFTEDGYTAELVGSVFNQDQATVPDGFDDPIDVGQAWNDLRREMAAAGGSGSGDSEPLLVGDLDPRPTETHHAGQSGEYTMPSDQEGVALADRAQDFGMSTVDVQGVDPADLLVTRTPPPAPAWDDD